MLCLALNLNLMKKNSLVFNFFYIGIVLICFLVFESCNTPKNVVYFQNLQKDTDIPALVDNNFELRIRKNDLLDINIVAPDMLTTPLFNGLQSIPTSSGEAGGSTAPSGGFLVDDKGNISMYKLGTVHVEGLTRKELKQKLETDLNIKYAYLKDAVVTVRFLNNHVTILGEVAKPQVLTMPTEKLSLLDALGMSGDITLMGRKDNVLVIRETSTGKQIKRINLTDNSVFTSPFYYLKPDDLIYVEPTQARIKNSGDTQQIIGYVLAGLSIAITILVNLIR